MKGKAHLAGRAPTETLVIVMRVSDHVVDEKSECYGCVDELKLCELCGGRFKPARSDAKFCSAKCKQKAYRCRLPDPAPPPQKPEPLPSVSAPSIVPSLPAPSGVSNICNPGVNSAQRAELNRLVEEYLAGGGKITVCPPGKTAHSQAEWVKILQGRSIYSRRHSERMRRKIGEAKRAQAAEEMEIRAREKEREGDEADHVGGGLEAGGWREADRQARIEEAEVRS